MVQRARASNVYKLLARPFSPYQGQGVQSSTSSHPLAGQLGHQYHTPEYNLNFGLQHLSNGHLFQETLETNTEVDDVAKWYHDLALDHVFTQLVMSELESPSVGELSCPISQLCPAHQALK